MTNNNIQQLMLSPCLFLGWWLGIQSFLTIILSVLNKLYLYDSNSSDFNLVREIEFRFSSAMGTWLKAIKKRWVISCCWLDSRIWEWHLNMYIYNVNCARCRIWYFVKCKNECSSKKSLTFRVKNGTSKDIMLVFHCEHYKSICIYIQKDRVGCRILSFVEWSNL